MQPSETEFLKIYQRNTEAVYRVCFLYLKQAADAEDAAQTVFLQLLQKNPNFSSLEHERAWLIVTAKNHCKNLLRHWWRRKRVDLTSLTEQALEKSPADSVLAEVLALPRDQRLAVYLYYYEGYRTAEIAQMLKQNESTIRSRLRLAREKLRLMLEEESI